jgi:predicted DNA-binding transcriptional regulator AlpA
MQTEILKDYISRDQLAEKIGKSVKTLVRWENDGKGPPVTRMGRDVLYSIPSFERWLKAQERAARGTTSANAA